MIKKFYIIDLRFKHSNFSLSNYIDDGAEILSLTPYSSFLLENIEKNFITFHNIISEQTFHSIVINKYKNFENIFNKFKELGFLFREFAFLLTYEEYINSIQNYLKNKKKQNFEIHYITDSSKVENKKINFLKESYLFNLNIIDFFVLVNQKNVTFYKTNKFINNFNFLRYKQSLIAKVINRVFLRKKRLIDDVLKFFNVFNSLKPIIPKDGRDINIDLVNKLHLEIGNNLKEYDDFFYKQYLSILSRFKNRLISSKLEPITFIYFTYLANEKDFFDSLIYDYNNIIKIFIQHGSYLYDHIFFKYNEIYPANINLVLNDYTKNQFLKYKTGNIYSIQSVNFNYKIKEDEEKKYDFLYITHCTAYSHNAIYIDGIHSFYSMDGNNIYQRHKQIIKLFATKFKDKKICIKVQPGIMTETMLYIPFLELSKDYSNVSIEFSVPIQKLILKSKYIISDYFSSEFINREIHYKRDIILFNSAPLILPEETVDDMNKMFILVETVDDLEEKIKNIEVITKHRLRYDDIIEYYSSKKCDTKKVIAKIIEKELNARNNS
ncbi:hypothetical protein AB0W38_07890 [Aliarcobacter butzleri]|uniref:hypothetical protein n=1 Tax=Aliarcobacter butzleri TaxID=28197 RepID=UPI00344B5FDB